MFVWKQSQHQPHPQSKARQLSTQLWNGRFGDTDKKLSNWCWVPQKVVKSFDEENNNDSNGFRQNKTMATEGESSNDSEYDGHGDDIDDNNFKENNHGFDDSKN